MIEMPEAINLANQLNKEIKNKTVEYVLPPTKLHKFCWFNGDATEYDSKIRGSHIETVEAFGIFVEINFDNVYRLCFNDGVNIRLIHKNNIPEDYQLVIGITGEKALVFTVAMYGGIWLHDGIYENDFYIKSKNNISPFDDAFDDYFNKMISTVKQTLSAKAFLATEQRFPGICNGCVQDILYKSGIHPKRKLITLSKSDKDALLSATKSVIYEMTNLNGRDTEKDLYGEFGGYITKMSKNTFNTKCSVCGAMIMKDNYLGGSIYYCPICQKLD